MKDLLKTYDVTIEEFNDSWMKIFTPQMIGFQIIFWITCLCFGSDKVSPLWQRIVLSLCYSFGGLLVYGLFTIFIVVISALIRKKPVGVIVIILGIIGTVIAVAV